MDFKATIDVNCGRKENRTPMSHTAKVDLIQMAVV